MEKNILSPEEEEELRAGQDFYEMMQTSGWKRLRAYFEGLSFHSWVDPREIDGPDAKKEWEWRELNGFHAANTARETLEMLQQTISKMEYLEKKKSGEIRSERMRV